MSKNMMKYYFRFALNLVFVLLSIGYIGPALISATDDLLYIAGVAYVLFFMPAVLYYANRDAVREMIKELEKQNEKS
jgi:hypothetical protein